MDERVKDLERIVNERDLREVSWGLLDACSAEIRQLQGDLRETQRERAKARGMVDGLLEGGSKCYGSGLCHWCQGEFGNHDDSCENQRAKQARDWEPVTHD